MKTPHTPPIDELLSKLDAIDLNQLDVQQQLIALRAGKDWNFFIIPITVLLLLAGLSIGLNFGKMVWGFIGGASFALLVGYAYHLWNVQWQQAAAANVVNYINELEGDAGFLPWFKPLLAKKNYRTLFYKLSKLGQIEIVDYARAVKRLQTKDRQLLKQQLEQLYPEAVTQQNP